MWSDALVARFRVLAASAWLLSIVACSEAPSATHGTGQQVGLRPDATAVAVIERAASVLERASTVQYDVQRADGHPDGAGGKFKGRTTVVATLSPLRFSATLRDARGTIVQSAASDGATTTADDGTGSAQESPTYSGSAMVVMNNAVQDVAGTRTAVDASALRSALSRGHWLYVGDDDIDGTVCQVVLHTDSSDLGGSPALTTSYYWISKDDGLPRAAQRWMLVRGRTSLSSQFLISNVRLNPAAGPTGIERPVRPSSRVAPAAAPGDSASAGALRAGSSLPPLGVRDLSWAEKKLTDFSGQPTFITLWAPWCGPCVNEFEALRAILPGFPGLQVVAIAVKDSRANVLAFVKQRPEFRFTFLTDPDMQAALSPLYDAIAGRDGGIPAGVFVDRSGRIVKRVVGFDGRDALAAEIRSFMLRKP